MKTNEELEAELEELKKEFYFFSKSEGASSGGGSSSGGGESGGSTSGDGDWILVYDKKSDDPKLNLGKTQGIRGGTGYISELPDLLQYSRIKLRFYCYNSLQDYEFMLQENNDYNGLRIVQHSGSGALVTANSFYEVVNGVGMLYIGNIRGISFPTGQIPGIVYLDDNGAVHYDKIWLKK